MHLIAEHIYLESELTLFHYCLKMHYFLIQGAGDMLSGTLGISGFSIWLLSQIPLLFLDEIMYR